MHRDCDTNDATASSGHARQDMVTLWMPRSARSRHPRLYGSDTNNGDMQVIDTWMLVACELGLDCGSGSRPLDRWCLKLWGCAQPDLAGAIRAVHGEAYFLKVDAQRRALVAQIRNRDLQGLFASVVATTGPAA